MKAKSNHKSQLHVPTILCYNALWSLVTDQGVAKRIDVLMFTLLDHNRSREKAYRANQGDDIAPEPYMQITSNPLPPLSVLSCPPPQSQTR